MFFSPLFHGCLPQRGFVSLQHCPLLCPSELSCFLLSHSCPQSLSSSRGSLTGPFPSCEAKTLREGGHCWPFLSVTVSQSVLSCHKGSRTVLLSATATCSNTQALITFLINNRPLVSVHYIKISVFSSSNLKLSNGVFKLTCQVLNLIMNMGYFFAILNIIKVQI